MKKKLLQAAVGLGSYLVIKAVYQKLRERNYSFKDKVVVLTGASRGLGLVIARKLADQGAKLVICARNVQTLKRAEKELLGKGAEVVAVKCDVTDPEQVKELESRTITHFGKIDVLINVAGIIAVGPYENQTLEDFDRHMKVHFSGPLHTMMAFIPHMKKNQESRIVNISSIGGKVSIPHLLPYNASKFALTGLSEGMRSELKKYNIPVTTVCPGLMRTGSPRNIDVKGQHEKEYKLFKTSASLPLFTISAETAAECILNACKRGDSELILGAPAKVANFTHAIFPGLTAKALSLVNNMLPEATPVTESKKGRETSFEKENTPITRKTDKAAAKNKEKPKSGK